MFSFICYGALITTVSPIVGLFMGAGAAHWLSSVFYYSIALLPVWHLLLNQLQWITSTLYKLTNLGQTQKMIRSIEWVKQVELLVVNRLTASIIDLRTFNIEELDNTIIDLKRQFTVSRLQGIPLVNNLARNADMATITNIIYAKCKLQQNHLRRTLRAFIDHLIDNIGNEIALLSQQHQQNKLTAVFPNTQIQAFAAFVRRYGTVEQTKRFLNTTNIEALWRKACSGSRMLLRTETPNNLHLPWGGFQMRADYLNGWEILLNSFMLDESKREAAIALNKLLNNQIDMTRKQFEGYIVDVVGEDKRFKQNLQTILFRSLTQRSASHANLISPQQKAVCQAWHVKNKAQISQAKAQFSQWLEAAKAQTVRSPFSTSTMIKLFKTIHAHECVAHTQGNNIDIERKHEKIRSIIKTNQGRWSWHYLLITHLPLQQQERYKTILAKKRLNWLLQAIANQRIKSHRFTDHDVMLFHGASIELWVKAHPCYHQSWSKDLSDFMLDIYKQGLCSRTLYLDYQVKHQNSHLPLTYHRKNNSHVQTVQPRYKAAVPHL